MKLWEASLAETVASGVLEIADISLTFGNILLRVEDLIAEALRTSAGIFGEYLGHEDNLLKVHQRDHVRRRELDHPLGHGFHHRQHETKLLQQMSTF